MHTTDDLMFLKWFWRDCAARCSLFSFTSTLATAQVFFFWEACKVSIFPSLGLQSRARELVKT